MPGPAALAIRGRPRQRARRRAWGWTWRRRGSVTASCTVPSSTGAPPNSAPPSSDTCVAARPGLSRCSSPPHPVKVSWLRRELNGDTAGVAFTDMTELGRNPARIIPAIRAFMDRYPGRRIRCVGEPVWADRSAAELREATRYEALVNTAFCGSPATMVCLYDTAELTSSVLDDAGCTHPALLRHGSAAEPSPAISARSGLPPGCDRPLSCPPRDRGTPHVPARPAAGAQPGDPVRAQRPAARPAHHRPGPGGQRGRGEHAAAHPGGRDRAPVA